MVISLLNQVAGCYLIEACMITLMPINCNGRQAVCTFPLYISGFSISDSRLDIVVVQKEYDRYFVRAFYMRVTSTVFQLGTVETEKNCFICEAQSGA